jgi:hypothetical protein
MAAHLKMLDPIVDSVCEKYRGYSEELRELFERETTEILNYGSRHVKYA